MALRLTFNQIELLNLIDQNTHTFCQEDSDNAESFNSFQLKVSDLIALENLGLIEFQLSSQHQKITQNDLIDCIEVKGLTGAGKKTLESFLEDDYKIEV